MNVLRYSNFFLAFTAILLSVCVVSIAVFGLEFGIEFTGGSLLEVSYQEGIPDVEEVRARLSVVDVGLVSVQQVGDNGILLRMKDLAEEGHQEVLKTLGEDAKEVRFESVGGIIGGELMGRAGILLVLAIGVIASYVMFAFRKVSRPVRFWEWSFVTLLTLGHDVLVPLGAISLFGRLEGVQITVPVMAALLTIVGYSVNDTVVIFDRIRENLIRRVGIDFADTVWQSLRQTFVRSLNTSLTVLLAVLAILFFGGETLRGFAFTMAIGIGAGSWSSLFVAPLLLEKLVKRHPS